MNTIETILFDAAGKLNTDATLEAAAKRIRSLGVTGVAVASNTGATAVKLARILGETNAAIVGVTLQAGEWKKYWPPDPAMVAEAEKLGVKMYTGTHALMGNLETAVREKFGGIGAGELISHAYYTFSQGMKVAVEVACMACDAGLLPIGAEAVAIAGTTSGADTAIVLTPTSTDCFFDVKVHEILAMPR